MVSLAVLLISELAPWGSSVYLHPVGDSSQCPCPGDFPGFGENQLACKYRPISLDG